ncbi:MAG: hypothetical protein WCP01_08385 [Methylococcaceae bacterium]
MKRIKCRDMPYLFGIQLSMQFLLMNTFMSHTLLTLFLVGLFIK